MRKLKSLDMITLQKGGTSYDVSSTFSAQEIFLWINHYCGLWYNVILSDHTREMHIFCSVKMKLNSSCLIVRSHVDWRGEQNIFYKGVETSP